MAVFDRFCHNSWSLFVYSGPLLCRLHCDIIWKLGISCDHDWSTISYVWDVFYSRYWFHSHLYSSTLAMSVTKQIHFFLLICFSEPFLLTCVIFWTISIFFSHENLPSWISGIFHLFVLQLNPYLGRVPALSTIISLCAGAWPKYPRVRSNSRWGTGSWLRCTCWGHVQAIEGLLWCLWVDVPHEKLSRRWCPHVPWSAGIEPSINTVLNSVGGHAV